jgi:hypothetical protein
MTSDRRRELKKQGKLAVEKRSAAFRDAFDQARPLSITGHRTARENEAWLREHMEYIPAAEVSRRFVVAPAAELGDVSPFVECMSCHDVLYNYPRESTQCSCGGLKVTFPKSRRGRPPVITARDDMARAVSLFAKG